jgi:hypothetical protein
MGTIPCKVKAILAMNKGSGDVEVREGEGWRQSGSRFLNRCNITKNVQGVMQYPNMHPNLHTFTLSDGGKRPECLYLPLYLSFFSITRLKKMHCSAKNYYFYLDIASGEKFLCCPSSSES